MLPLRLSNDTTEVDMDRLAGAFSVSRDELETRLRLGTITYWFELGPGDKATPRAVFRSVDTGQRVTLDRVGRIMSPEDEILADQPEPCSETCRPAGMGTGDSATPTDTIRTDSPIPPQAGARHLDDLLDEALRESFPASDPIAICFDRARPARQ